MLDAPVTSLREQLRHATAEDHGRLDALFGQLDLTAARDLARFFAAHHGGFSAIQASYPEPAGFVQAGALAEMVAALEADMRLLGGVTPVLTVQKVGREAVDHIVLGSRLGTAVLRRAWQAASDSRVQAASRYFSLPGMSASWRSHTRDLTSRSPTGPDAERVISDTKALYHLFERAFHATE